ncbi:hypothetical protein HA402_004979 [Bradysia odoriphaga]|nr:hypothetical protein HA402_004979 [Bradysia odoriphaga]
MVVVLQRELSLDDSSWNYQHVQIPIYKPPKGYKSSDQQKIPIKFVTITQENGITLDVISQTTNRVLSKNNPECFVGISFEKFQFKEPYRNKTAGYIEKLLNTGLKINGVSYYFYGHSNSQLKKKVCYLVAARSGDESFKKINELGDFAKIASVAKRAKRIGLLFSAADSSIQLDEKKCLDIDDVEDKGHVFTDGCGLLSKKYAKRLSQLSNIVFHNDAYTPSVYQIRYKGYKGTLMVAPSLVTEHYIHFRASMKKFTACPDNTFSVLDYSKPYTFGYLNGELVTLLSTLGISDDVFLRKQQEYFMFLQNALLDPHAAFIFLSYKGEHEMAERVLNGIEPLQESIRRLQKEEWKGSYDKKDKERVRIMIRKSRLLYGVADYTETLNEGEVLVRITTEGKGVLALDGAEVIVGRNPCLHPGDIRKFKAVRCDRLEHLEDCIVFPTKGTRDAASLMSGGDLDGDRFFVSWDPDIIPEKLYEPYAYPPAKEIHRREVRQEDMIRYFANYNNASLGKVKNLYLGWARCSSDVAGSRECQELNALFSSCVDGERITIPERLQNPPEMPDGRKFILDTLCDNVKLYANSEFNMDADGIDETPEELLENLLVSSEVCLTEFELFQLANRWCRKNLSSLEDYLHCFDFGAFTHQQKHLAMQQFESSVHKDKISRLVFNELTSSKLLSGDDLSYENLDDKRIHWQKFYSSSDDDGIRLEMNISKALELFERKFIVFRVDESLRVGIYLPRRLIKNEELFIGEARDSAKLFAFANGTPYKRSTQEHYKLYFDGDMIQLFDKHRRNTFVWLGLQNGKFPSKNADTEFKVSIALQKFDRRLQESRSKVTKQESKGMELYVLSNRDRVGHQILDITMSQKDTTEIVRLLNDIPREYSLDIELKEDVSWINREFCSEIVLRDDFSQLLQLTSMCQLEQIFHIYHSISHEKFTRAVDYVMKNLNSFEFKQEIWHSLFNWMNNIPIISCLVIEALSDYEQHINYPMDKAMGTTLVHAVIQTANYGKELVSVLLRNLLQVLVHQNIKFDMNDLTRMVKTIVFCVRHVNVADDLLNQLFDEEIKIFELADGDGDHDACFKYFKDVTLALAKDLIGEISDKCPCDSYGIPQGAEDDDSSGESTGKNRRKTILSDYFPSKLRQQATKFYGTKPEPVMKCVQILASDEEGILKVNLRTDVSTKIRNGDHLRFCASRRSIDSPNERISVFDAIADSVQNGVLNFKLKQPAPREMYVATWNMYCCANTITFNAMLSATKTLVTLKSESTAIYRSILGLPQPNQASFPFDLKRATFQPHETQFNDNQRSAIQEALNNHLTLIWGPPGTGKTTVIVEIILQFLLHRNDLRILVSASTHNAVDNVLSRFVQQRKARFNDPDSSDVIRIASDTGKVSKQMAKWTLDAFVGANIYKNSKAMREAENRLANAAIVFSTCSAAGVGLLRGGQLGDDEDTKNKKKREQRFDVVIVDEASQITEPNALVPIVKNSKFVILVGDHKQLRPSVSEIAKECGLETSLFEKLYTSEADSPHCKKIMLNMQFRMHEALARFPSEKFYDGQLLTGVKSVDRIIPESEFPWPQSQDGIKFPAVFVDCLDLENHQVGSTSKKNVGQCQMAYEIIKALRAGDVGKHLTITVLSPYTMQVSELRHRLVGGNIKVDVETVDSFQGRESDIIIYSTVVANTSNRLGFLDDARRMNVAITRAKFGLILIGHKRTLTSNKLWKSCIEEFCEEVKFPKKA